MFINRIPTRKASTSAFTTFTSQYPPAQSNTYVKATNTYLNYYPYNTTNPELSLTGLEYLNQWLTASTTNKRFHIDLGSAKEINRIYYENCHADGGDLNSGVNNFTFWGSNSATAFAQLTYAIDTDWIQLTRRCSKSIF